MLSAKGMPSDLPQGLDPLERNRQSFAAGSRDGTPRLPPSSSTAGFAPRERGRLARNLIPRWRRWSVSARLPAGSPPAGVYGMGQSE